MLPSLAAQLPTPLLSLATSSRVITCTIIIVITIIIIIIIFTCMMSVVLSVLDKESRTCRSPSCSSVVWSCGA